MTTSAQPRKTLSQQAAEWRRATPEPGEPRRTLARAADRFGITPQAVSREEARTRCKCCGQVMPSSGAGIGGAPCK